MTVNADSARRELRRQKIRDLMKSSVVDARPEEFTIRPGQSVIGDDKTKLIIGDQEMNVVTGSSGGMTLGPNSSEIKRTGAFAVGDNPSRHTYGDFIPNPVNESFGSSTAASPRPAYLKMMPSIIGTFAGAWITNAQNIIDAVKGLTSKEES